MRKSQYLFLCLFVCISNLVFAADADGKMPLELSAPSLALSGLPVTIEVSGLPDSGNLSSEKLEAPYKMSVNGQAVKDEFIDATQPDKLKVRFEAGQADIIVSKGDYEGAVTIRCIPGWLSLLPPLIAIILALLTREVLSSLLIGIWAGAMIYFDFNPLQSFLRVLDKYILESLADTGHAAIVIFSVTLGGMVGILNRTGGMQGIVELISKKVVGPKSAQLATWIMGVLIFFDDYANTLIVGNSMRPVCDRNRISREKLSYIVDSTSAPVAGIAVLSTWIGYEIGLIRQAFMDVGLAETNFYGVFIETIPYRFYCILALFFGFWICVTDKEFGPMLTAERRARHDGKPLADGANPISNPESAMPQLPDEMPKRWYNAAIPIATVIVGAFLGLMGSGGLFSKHADIREIHSRQPASAGFECVRFGGVQSDMRIVNANHQKIGAMKLRYSDRIVFDGESGAEAVSKIEGLESGSFWVKSEAGGFTLMEQLRSAFADADSSRVLLWVSALGSLIALFLGFSQGLVSLGDGMQAWVNGAKSMAMAVFVLVLAWSINSVCKDLQTADYIVELVKGTFPAFLLPTLIFIIACLVSFATGTSWGTMAILLPISIPLAYHLNKEYFIANLAATSAITEYAYVRGMMLVAIGAVLEGSIFGDHCSPISDTTIMSSMASGADHVDHVKSQAPYALIVAIVSIVFGYIPAGLGFSPLFLFPLAAGALIFALKIFGKNVETV